MSEVAIAEVHFTSEAETYDVQELINVLSRYYDLESHFDEGMLQLVVEQ